jgi:hypothetical protein
MTSCQVHGYHYPSPLRTRRPSHPAARGRRPRRPDEPGDGLRHRPHERPPLLNLLWRASPADPDVIKGKGTRKERALARQGFDAWVIAGKPGHPVYEARGAPVTFTHVQIATAVALIVGYFAAHAAGLLTKAHAPQWTLGVVTTVLATLAGVIPTVVWNENDNWKTYLLNVFAALFAATMAHRSQVPEASAGRHAQLRCRRFQPTRPFAPTHGPGDDPYVVHEYADETQRRTRFTGELLDA